MSKERSPSFVDVEIKLWHTVPIQSENNRNSDVQNLKDRVAYTSNANTSTSPSTVRAWLDLGLQLKDCFTCDLSMSSRYLAMFSKF